ncbi:MAG TPA: ABC transporter ATP-binding protein [Chthoniobacterales bacterium]
MPIYRRTFAYFRPFLPQTLLALGLSLLGIALNLAKPWPIGVIVDRVIPQQTGIEWLPSLDKPTLILIFCAALIVIHFVAGLIGLATNYIFVKVGLEGLLRLRTELYAYLQSLPLKYHDTRRSSDSSFRVAYDSQALQTIYNKGFTNIFSSGLLLIGTFAIMVRIDWQLTLVSLSILPFVAWSIYYYGSRVRRESTLIQEQDSEVLSIVQEGLSSVRMVHAFGREEWEVQKFKSGAKRSLEAHLKLTWTNVLSALVVGTLMAAGTAGMYFVGFHHLLDNSLSLGKLTIFASYVAALYKPLEDLTYTAWALEGATAGAKRCFEVLDREDEVKDRPNAIEWTGGIREIAFRDVQFGYKDDRRILQNINLSITSDQTVAFVGGTGAGKSTLLSLVPRFYDPDAGAVLFNGRDLRDYTKKSIRSQISIVLQDTLLFSTTIRENIAYGRPEATDDEIIEAARRAQAHDFISALPEGYLSQVGERGGHLSVGQRQRIGIARAFLKNSPLLLLDEPTSALDPATEHAIMETIYELMEGRTTLIVTHRLSTIHGVDRIVVLKNGQVVEQGTGTDLLAAGGDYATLYKSADYAGT